MKRDGETLQAHAELEEVLAYWRGFDLDGKRLNLDQQCVEMREARAQTLEARKRLNELTKEWRGQR
jgi:CelD/BcsL family acetyltransferase involved in cellulose biosynthesis